MKKFYLLSLLFLLLLSNAAFSQMQRVIRNYNGSVAQTIINSPVNNFANAVTSCSLDTILLTTQAQINNFATNYPTCANPKYLIINGLGASPAITSLAGLSSVTQVINKLKITNTSVINLSQLTSLTQIGDTLELEKNNLLTSIGLNNLTQLGSIYFKNLPALTSIAGLSNNITIMNNVRLDSTLALSNILGLGNITHYNGNVEIGYTAITGLSALNNCNYIQGWLWINNNPNVISIGLTNLTHCGFFLLSDMPLLTSLAGLTTNITNIQTGTFWVINTGVTNLNGLQNLTGTSNFYIIGNPNLTNITALQNLSGDIGGGFSIYGNPLLTSIAPLSNITAVSGDGTIEISYNNISTLIGLQNIINIGKGLRVAGNNNLTTLSALNNNLVIQNNPDSYNGIKDSVEIFDNTQLVLCSDTSICYYLNGGGAAFINNNAVGCNTIAEILSTCTAGINYNDFEDNCCTNNAIPIAQGQIKYGNVGHYKGLDGGGNVILDDYDTYRIILPYDGAFKLFVTAKNDSSCFENTSTDFNIDVLEENSNTVQIKNLLNWAQGQACNINKTDSFKFRGYRGDTIYLRFYGDKISYNISWQALDSTMTGNEFNNDRPTAYLINPLQTKKGNVGFKNNNYHTFDIYKTVLPVSANIEVYLKITNRENQTQPAANRLHFDWGYTLPYGNFSNSNYPLIPAVDGIITDTIRICGLANDSMFFRVIAPTEAYEYEWSYKIKDTLANDAFEPNNNLATATPVAVSQTRSSTIGYTGKILKDNEDNFVTVFPQNGIVKIFVQATSSKCDAGYLNLAGINKQQSYVFARYITGNTNIPTQTTVYDTLLVCGQPADTFYFKFLSNAAFNYQFRYDMIDPIPNAPEDPEPNNSFATAVPFNEMDSVNGRIRFLTVPTLDEQDYYRTILPKDGVMNIILKTTNYECGNNYVNFKVFDRNQNYFYFNQFFSQTGTTRYDTIKLCGLAADTFYINIHSFSKFVYSIKYQIQDTSVNDAEPNNSFATALNINETEIKKGHIGYRITGAYDYDYYKTILPKDGTMKIIVQITNKSCANGHWVYARFYDRRQANGEFYQKYIGNTTNVSSGQTVYDTILFCGRAADTFYLRYEAGIAFNYEFKYEMADTSANDIEPNNSFATAININENQIKKGHIKYYSNGGSDDYDYYKTILPKDGTVKVYIKAKNTSCANGQYMYARFYDRRQGNGEFYQKYVPSSASVLAGEIIYDTVTICSRAADTMYIRFEASNSFQYEIKYEVVDTSANDVEPNNSFATAININENQIKAGHINYYSIGGADSYDYYKTLIAKDGTLKIIVQATNMGCVNGAYISVTGFDKRQDQGQIFQKYINNNIAAGQTVYDTILLCGRGVDSFYLKFEANTAFKYQWSYAMMDTSANDVEPNNSFAQATLVGGGQTKYGHIKYRSNGGYDDLDFYKFVFSNTDSLKIKIQAINKSCADGQWMSLQVFDKNFNQLISRYIATNVAANQTIYDSIKILVNAPDTIYLRLDASYPFQYQFTTNPRQPTGLFTIAGDSTVCFGTKIYKAINVVDNNVVYNWALSGGGSLTFVDSIATVNWTTNGTQNLSLYLSNIYGNSLYKQKTVIVNNNPPTEVPLLLNFARTLSTNNLPSGTVCKWYKSGVEIADVTDSIYYAQDSGTYTVRFVRPCGTGPASNSFYFPLPAQVQNISFTHTPNIIFSPTAKAKLNATASSGLSVSFQLISGNATIINDTVYVTSGGTVIVKAIQQGSNIFAAAAPKYDTIAVLSGPQTITFNPIPSQIFSSNALALTATASSGLPIVYNIVSGNAYIYGSSLGFLGAGLITVQATQPGNINYAAATPVQQTFCTGIRNLIAIYGSVSPCLNNYIYTTDKIPAANYVWTLSSGGTMVASNDTAYINWTIPGTHTISVKANTACDAVYSNVVSLTITTANNAPTSVSNMLPLNNAVNQQLPLALSWQPGLYTVNYDLYVWDSAQAQPALPFAANIVTVNFTLPQNSFVYSKAYKWRIVSKNPCSLTLAGPVQQFRLVPLPDLAVTQVLAPTTAFSGQTISINWTVKNNGPGRTQTNQTWADAVYLSFDSIPKFNLTPETNPAAWNQLQFPIRPLLIASKPNVSALDSGQVYSNTANFTLPLNYNQPLFVYVITNNPANPNLPQVTYVNDTARAVQPIVVTLSPTPDLRVDTVFSPASTFSGSTVNITYKVKNYGVVTPPNVSWFDKFYISPTAIFNPANAVELFLPKAYSRYYDCSGNYNPGMIHTTQLNADSSYTNAVPLVIPNFIVGTYFIHVKTNNTASLYEGAFINNNTNSNQIQVYLTPTPLLDVANLFIQNTNVSTTQNVSVNWNINNGGFFDNLQKGQGHYAKQGAFCANIITGYTNPGNQPITVAGFYYTDSIAVGSSYWNDKIYLSRDSGAIETANLILLNKYDHGLQNNAPPCDNYNGTCLAGGNNDRNVFNIIKPVTNYPSVATINIPDTLSAGNYYVYVLANADKTVYEYPNNNKYKRSGIITVNRPDLIPPTVSVQPNSNAGVPIQINYTISNAGMGNVYNHLRRDKYFVSTSPVFTGGAVQIGIQIFTENVLTGSPVTHSFNYTFPPGTPSGNRYFYVVANYDSAFRETTMANNTSAAAATFVTIAVAKDLIVSNVQLPANPTDTVFTLNNVSLKYTVVNNGTDSIAGKTWVDSVFVSCTPSFNSSTAFYLSRRLHSDVLASGQNYTDSFNIFIPKFSYELNNCFGIDNTNAYFFVRTNADSAVYEGANMANNYTASSVKKLFNQYVDLIVPSVGGADTATVARSYTVNWSTKNIKLYTIYGYDPYVDGIYFSPDSVFNANAIFVFSNYDDRRLGANQTSTSTASFTLPNIPAGDYYVHVKTNKDAYMRAEKNISNNTNLIRNGVGAAKKINVKTTPLPDITDSIITAPALLAVGQSYNVKYKIKNEGVGISFPNFMITGVYLSPTTLPNGILLQQTANFTPLQPGTFYTDSITINIPINTIPGNYVLVINADNNNNIVESNKTNNITYKYVTVYSPAPSDLIVQNVSHPDSVYLGYTIDSLKWIVSNNSANAAQGVSADGMYLSASGIFDSSATLIGIKNKTINMLPLANDSLQAQPLVNNVTEGSYKVFIKTDLLNNIVESNKDNNVGTPTGNIYVKVKELVLNVLTPNTLAAVQRYYKLIIPNNLSGSTILVTLKSNDSLSSTNQMYIGKGFIPSAAHFDYQYDKPNYGNQNIVITSVTAGDYYITVSKISSTVNTQTISLKAVKLPFAILNVQSSSGGNTGNVTVKISGSLFSNNMVAKLVGNTATITASAVYFVNTTSVFATYNLTGKPLGIYDVTLSKPDTTMAILAGGFSIVPANNGGLITGGGTNGTPGNGNDAACDPNAPSGLNAQLVSQIVLPPKVFGGWPFVIQINYNNPTNVDIAAQTRILYCIDGFPISFTVAGLANATSSIYLELTEPGGPPGIIRAGGSGTITLYSKPFVTFPAHEYGNYILK